MSTPSLSLPPELLAECFPFYMGVDRSLIIFEAGPGLERYHGDLRGAPLASVFQSNRATIERIVTGDLNGPRKPEAHVLVSISSGLRLRGRHGDRRAHLDRVQAEIVVQVVELCDGVQVIDTAVGAVCPYRLVLGLLCQEVAVLVVEDARALNNAPAVTSMGGRSAPRYLEFGFRFATDL